MNWKFWIGLLISLLFLFLAFHKIDFSAMGKALSEANYVYLFPIAILYYLAYVFRAFRWHHIMKPIKSIGFRSLFSATIIGFTANMLLPARLGEFVRAYQVGKTEQISKTASFATIVVERLFDGFTILGVLVVVLLLLEIPADKAFMGQLLKKGGYASLLFYAVVIFFLFLLRMRTEMVLAVMDRVTRFLPERFAKLVSRILYSFADGLEFLSGPGCIALIVFYSLLIWALGIVNVHMTAMAFGVELPVMASMLVMVMTAFGVMIPSAPGFVGTYHAACSYAFLFYNIPREKALSIAIVMHAGFFFSTMALGVAVMASRKLSLKDLKIPTNN
ncbi:MAG: flippase-like domain-containing protein [Desulfobacterales bacterium]|nr:flippase-like domain-containing protein [Desulfobacterales bacterium]